VSDEHGNEMDAPLRALKPWNREFGLHLLSELPAVITQPSDDIRVAFRLEYALASLMSCASITVLSKSARTTVMHLVFRHCLL
jgi:hypothetical protein